MTQEEKDLLLKDLCARLPYGVKCSHKNENVYSVVSIDLGKYSYIFITNNDGFRIGEPEIKNIKPYLFPLSSMTEEQKRELYNLVEETAFQILHSEDDNPHFHIAMDWYNKNHFDYRGLIPMGLANDATGKNIY